MLCPPRVLQVHPISDDRLEEFGHVLAHTGLVDPGFGGVDPRGSVPSLFCHV